MNSTKMAIAGLNIDGKTKEMIFRSFFLQKNPSECYQLVKKLSTSHLVP